MIESDADKVWDLVGDPSLVATWAPGIDSVTVEGNKRRAVRGGAIIVEEIVTIDPELRRLQYRFIEGEIMNPEFHLATIDVIEVGPRSLVIFSTDVTPDEYKTMIDAGLPRVLSGLKAYVEGTA
jgi:uncharacterized protein YndB with AHSA1/START domain